MACVCRAVAGLHRRPDSDSEIVTQELFGHRVRVHSSRRGYARCTLRDGYSGWVAEGSLSTMGEYPATHLVKKRFAWIRFKGASPLLVSMGSLLKVESTGAARYVVELPDGRAGTVAEGSVEATGGWDLKLYDLPLLLDEVIGTPYLWGGKSTFGFDCSGLVQFVFGLLGIDLPRDSGDQARKGRLIRDLRELSRFDLVFFGTGRGIDHVAIHLGDLQIAHASGHVRIESLDRSSPRFRADLHRKFRFARRIVRVQG